MRAAIACCLVFLAAACAVRAAEDVIAVSGMDELEKLIKKHPFLVVEVREEGQAAAGRPAALLPPRRPYRRCRRRPRRAAR